MRIIAGKYRSRKLKSPPSLQTRPTSDRLRETLFNVLAPRIEGARFLDLCAGSGAVGIEALSRGAVQVTFVERSRKMCALIEANLDALDVPHDEANIGCNEAAAFLRRSAPPAAAFDIIFFDPPYVFDYEGVLDYLGRDGIQLLTEDGLVVVEHYNRKNLSDEFGLLHRARLLKQGDSCLSLYRRQAA